MVEEETVDCHDESKQVSGCFTMIEENLAVPFEAVVLGVTATVERIDMTETDQACFVATRP